MTNVIFTPRAIITIQCIIDVAFISVIYSDYRYLVSFITQEILVYVRYLIRKLKCMNGAYQEGREVQSDSTSCDRIRRRQYYFGWPPYFRAYKPHGEQG